MSDFIFGFFSPFHGLRLLFADSRLRALAILPLALSLVLGSILSIAGIYGLTFAIGSISLELGTLLALDPAGFGSIIITIFLWPSGLLLLGAGVYVLVRLVAAPFYSYLAEKTLVKLGTRQDHPFVFQTWVWISFRMFWVSLVKAVLFAFAGGILFVFSLVPVLNIIATIGFVHMLAFDVSDYAFEAMEWPLARRFAHVRNHMMTYTGLACGMGLAMLIPGLNLVLMPAAVVGASATLHRTLGTSREF